MLTQETKQNVIKYVKQYLADYTHYKSTRVWCYEDGVILLGAYDLYLSTKDRYYLDFCLKFLNNCIDSEGNLTGFDKHSCSTDDLLAGEALYLINASFPDKKYELALAKLREQYDIHPRTSDGSFFHKNRYPNQVWLDGLYMAQPLYCLFGVSENSVEILNDSVHQFSNVEHNLFDESTGRYMHAYDESRTMPWANKDTGRSSHVWLRSVGWYAMASVDVWEILKNSNYSKLSEKLFAIPEKVISSLDGTQDSITKMYKDLPFISNEDNYLETSGSVMIAYASMKGSRIGCLSKDYLQKGAEIFEGVVNNFLKDGQLKNICSVSGLDDKGRDGTVRYYLSEKIVSNDAKGVGPFMMALSEYLKSL